ncbi:MAG: hypothetical protein A3G32_06735 [Deltaproteobacteria bacterium RIFCSPLOWO2_12_FULL_40_28]|nr:MAG: hypothetical protein A3C45_06780 [Deltaproteobacteria bacterium RIFCSPHIGHO2_02_FULL_40_28]OGQ19345.1 MAG: hypothetical protein A3E27_05035 [Deltaproteobacteria bacterium RIFCSPHIGHO2_12_FULL_40_32]OGQ40431.1 MAG: hypothetical protein A3I69_00035 [Deltaproteobacteria bacterium RIFCSPLOWO2_02_FULL_40_36]OGQ53667.1 MAG: hypothetical protein A3G32_06735 [Deltaproteobacteria bacterium RIFCSPLOWO2_12_FULL_40_28]
MIAQGEHKVHPYQMTRGPRALARGDHKKTKSGNLFQKVPIIIIALGKAGLPSSKKKEVENENKTNNRSS